MNKFIKILLIILGVLALGVVILYLTGPKTYEISRGVLIKADRETVWNQINFWENHKKWSPWVAREKNMEIKITGTDGAVGSTYSWVSKTQGTGHQTILESKPMDLRIAELSFDGWGSSKTAFKLSDSGDGTYLVWNMYGENGFFSRVMQSLFNFEKMMAPDYESGLANIKKVCEEAGSAAAKYKIGEVEMNDFKATTFVSIRREMSMDEFEKDGPSIFKKAAEEIYGFIGKNKLEVKGTMSALYYKWDTKARRVDLAVSVPVDKEARPEGKISIIKISDLKCATLEVMGDYSGLGKAHDKMEKWLTENKKEGKSPVIEEYVTDPSTQKDPMMVLTRIWYPLM